MIKKIKRAIEILRKKENERKELKPFMKDMSFLIITFLQRGAVISKIAKKNARDFASVLRMLIIKYSIRADKTNSRAEALGPEIIILPRIAACLSQITTSFYNAGFDRAIANFSEFENCSPALFSPMFPSVVRKSYRLNDIIYNIYPQLTLIAILIDNILHIRDRVTPLEQIQTYYLAAYQSAVIIDSTRTEQCNKFGVTIDGIFSNQILKSRDHCKRRITELRRHERIEDFIREMDEIM